MERKIKRKKARGSVRKGEREKGKDKKERKEREREGEREREREREGLGVARIRATLWAVGSGCRPCAGSACCRVPVGFGLAVHFVLYNGTIKSHEFQPTARSMCGLSNLGQPRAWPMSVGRRRDRNSVFSCLFCLFRSVPPPRSLQRHDQITRLSCGGTWPGLDVQAQAWHASV